MDLIYLSSGNPLRDFRKEQYDKQGGICPILKKHVPFEDTVVDHLHGKKNDLAGVNNAHMVRGIIHNGCNAADGAMLSIYKRRGLAKIISFPEYLRNLADYLDNPPLIGTGYVHPHGKPKRATIGKREFNRLNKYWPKMYSKRKCPVWKDNGRKKETGRMNLTKQLKIYIEESDAIHFAKY